MRISHVPAHTMQVDWAGTKMEIFDPVTGTKTPESVFVASLPYSGMVFACGCLSVDVFGSAASVADRRNRRRIAAADEA